MIDTKEIPKELIDSGKFCCWRLEQRDGRQTKVPYDPNTGQLAKSNDPGTFAPFAVANAAQGYSGTGLGIFDGFCAIDLDDCVTDSGYFTEPAASVVELPGFPVSMLPMPVCEFVKAIAESSQTSPGMAAVISLGVLATCLQGKYRVQGKPGYYEPVNLYTLVIASPGERKSGVIREMTHVLYDYEIQFNVKHMAEVKANARQRESLERKISGLKKKLETKENREMELELQQYEEELDAMPKEGIRRFFADDCSSEALTTLLANNGGKMEMKRSSQFHVCRGKYFSKTEELFPILELLEEYGYIKIVAPEYQGVGSPPDVRVLVNPAAEG